MAHKTKDNAIKDLARQVNTEYSAIIVWRKDFERWGEELKQELLKYSSQYDSLDHYHIEFSRDQARVLWDWLSDFLEEDTETKYQNDLEAERDDWDMEELDD